MGVPAARHAASGAGDRRRPDLGAVRGGGPARRPRLPAGRPARRGRGAAVALRARCPRLVVAGTQAPPYGFESAPGGVAAIRDALRAAAPGLVFVGLGFPKQDRLIEVLRADLPGAWFVGCGSAVAFAAGAVRRAPEWMRGVGLEWLFRLLSEPGRLARRYLVHDVPFALRLLAGCVLRRAVRRVVRRAPTPAPGSGTPRRG
ncbi:WecB/TagA/CpsF family glycosyltransferase [Microtetraspora malaysiensis]|uniref:WecB/TagA/CpsF family glycosyltransferase n=1 Tax=Microtetraspora malaysiensis TaxID=161358 RepID=UPI003D91CCA4